MLRKKLYHWLRASPCFTSSYVASETQVGYRNIAAQMTNGSFFITRLHRPSSLKEQIQTCRLGDNPIPNLSA